MTSERPIRFGICGLGFMGRQYFNHLRNHPHAQVTAVCDQDAARRSGDWADRVGNINVREGQRVDMKGINAYADWDAVTADENVHQVAVIITPQMMTDEEEIARVIAEIKSYCNKPIVGCLMGHADVFPAVEILREHGVPCFTFPESAMRALAASTSGWSSWPGMPISRHRSFEPISTVSTPGTAAIASTFSMARGDSTITTTSVAAFSAGATSACGALANPVCGRAPVIERWPCGG